MLKNSLFSSPVVSDKLVDAVKGIMINESKQANRHRENLGRLVKLTRHHFKQLTSPSNQTDPKSMKTDGERRAEHARRILDLHDEFNQATLMAKSHLHPNELDRFYHTLRDATSYYDPHELHGLASAHARKFNR